MQLNLPAFQVKIANSCPSCGGASKQAAVSSPCQLCYGSGEVMRKHTAMHGRGSFWSCHVPPEELASSHTMSHLGAGKLGFLGSCPMCGGNGAHVQQWCSSCGGRGLARFKRLLRVRIPPGMPPFFQQISKVK